MGPQASLTVALWSPPGLMGTSTVEQLLENVCLLLASRTRDVVKSALGFIKVAVVVMDVARLAKHAPLVVSAPLPLGGWQPGLWPAGREALSLEASKFQTCLAAHCLMEQVPQEPWKGPVG